MTTTHHGLRWGPVEAVKVPEAEAPKNRIHSTMAEALSHCHQPIVRGKRGSGPSSVYCRTCYIRWPCDTAILIQEWHAERRRVEQLEDAIRLFRERVREYCDPSLGAEHPEDIDAALTELLACQEALLCLVRERQQ